jgi:hypothetical protein
MAYRCVNGNKWCDGCGKCSPQPDKCPVYGEDLDYLGACSYCGYEQGVIPCICKSADSPRKER